MHCRAIAIVQSCNWIMRQCTLLFKTGPQRCPKAIVTRRRGRYDKPNLNVYTFAHISRIARRNAARATQSYVTNICDFIAGCYGGLLPNRVFEYTRRLGWQTPRRIGCHALKVRIFMDEFAPPGIVLVVYIHIVLVCAQLHTLRLARGMWSVCLMGLLVVGFPSIDPSLAKKHHQALNINRMRAAHTTKDI